MSKKFEWGKAEVVGDQLLLSFDVIPTLDEYEQAIKDSFAYAKRNRYKINLVGEKDFIKIVGKVFE